MNCTFTSDNLTGLFQVPSYYAWLAQADLTVPYAYYKRMLKLLQPIIACTMLREE